MYRIEFSNEARKQLKSLKNNKSYLRRLFLLIDDVTRHPFIGLGKPEPLKYELTGLWSRRINKKNRLVYEVVEPDIIIFSVIEHYENRIS